ncbi:hypothetical protein FACS1894120_1090 [Clostridia bacterium]|nr:hypothetical protein FACS1894120_1090 [Clostridia bacterium]
MIITNERIEKQAVEIEKTRKRIAELTVKLREQIRYKIKLEDLAIVAMFRDDTFSDDELKELMSERQRRREQAAALEQPPELTDAMSMATAKMPTASTKSTFTNETEEKI